MGNLKRYLPLVGTAILAAVAILRAAGLNEAADVVSQLGGGFVSESTVGAEPIAAAVAALVGAGLKVKSEVGKALNGF